MEATQVQHFRRSNFIERLVASKIFWVLAVTFLFSYPLVKSIKRQLPSSLPVYLTLPEFALTDENGKTYGSTDLKGKVYLAHFMSSDCGGECALGIKQMQQVQHRIRGVIDRAAIVSITIDPANDTPAVLFAKARELNANPVVWRFLTGPMAEIQSLLLDGFKVPGEAGKVTENVADVVRAHRLALVDQEGNVRGYYLIEKSDINKLMIDLGLLINRKKNS